MRAIASASERKRLLKCACDQNQTKLFAFSARPPVMDSPVPEDFEERLWRRHSNPKSGWSRTVLMPALLFAVYHRNWRLAGAALLFTVLNPILFAPPENDNAWMTRVVLAERWWTREQQEGIFDFTYPNGLNLLNIPISVYAFVAAYRRQPVQASVAGVLSMALKFWYVGALVHQYDTANERAD